MEQIYALGIVCIEFIQEWFADSEWYFKMVNDISNPHHITEILFPVMCTIDSVFGAQLLLCMSFGGWLNSVMKWWFQEDRPYWWVRETTYYSQSDKPLLRQTIQSCETGPGSPSGHSAAAATTILLALMWTKHVMHDRKCYFWWWKYLMYPLSAFAMGSVMLSRMFIATHFPHQCLVGALVGSFLAPALCIYVSDPYIWRYGFHAQTDPRKALSWHVIGSVVTIVIGILVYYSMVFSGIDPQWTVKLAGPKYTGYPRVDKHGGPRRPTAPGERQAFRWCESPEHIHVTSTPIFALVQSTASLLGLALCVTPAIAEYRHYTKHRSIIIAALAVGILSFGTKHILDNMCKANALRFYAIHFLMAALKPMLLLRVAPAIAMWPFEKPKAKVE